MHFFVAMQPGVKGNHKRIVRFGKRLALVASDKNKAQEESLIARLTEFRPAQPLTGPVRLDVTFFMRVPVAWPAWKLSAALHGKIYPWRRPDRGNLLKLVEDALAGAFYLDDAQVVEGNVVKAYGAVPGYQITLTQLVEATHASWNTLEF